MWLTPHLRDFQPEGERERERVGAFSAIEMLHDIALYKLTIDIHIALTLLVR